MNGKILLVNHGMDNVLVKGLFHIPDPGHLTTIRAIFDSNFNHNRSEQYNKHMILKKISSH